MNLLNSLLRGLIGRLGLYLLIVLVLAGGAFAVAEFREFREGEKHLPEWQHIERSLREQFDESTKALETRAKELQQAPVEQLKKRIREVDQSIANTPRLPQSNSDFARAIARDGFQQVELWVRQGIQLEMLRRERDYLNKLLATADRNAALRELERLRQEIIRYNEVHEVVRAAMTPPPRVELEARLKTWKMFLDRAWQAYREQKERMQIRSTNPLRLDHTPEVGAAAQRELALADAELERWRLEIVRGNVGYDNLRYVMDPPPPDKLERDLRLWRERLDETWRHYNQLKVSIEKESPPPDPKLQPPAADEVPQLRALTDSLEQARSAHGKHWIALTLSTLQPFLWPAFFVMVGVSLTHCAIRAFFFYALAPIATRRPGVALLPESSGRMLTGRELPGQTSEAASSVSCRVTVDASKELLLHPEYRQSLPNDCEARTQWILNRAIPLSSLAAGLYALTRIRATTPQTVVVSSTRDPLSEVSLITIPEGSAAMLLPRQIVGVLQTRGAPLRITRHWRFGLHAWLTLQLRYLVFHGPVTLVVKGCRGVRVEPAEAGRSLNPAATIGFSANLRYSSRRCETFWGYLTGQQPLLNDSFAGGNGCYVYQEMPDQRRGGVFGRGLEGVFDAMLKPLGI